MEDMMTWINDLRKSGKIIIVEGKKDRIALEHFGITKIVEVNPGPLYKVIEEVAAIGISTVILTDFDKKGKQLYGKLRSGLGSLGIEIDNRFRQELHRTKLSHIEGLVSFVENNGAKKD